MDIVIYGCGAIGSVIATLIKISKKSELHTIFLVGRETTVEKMTNDGIIYTPYGKSENAIRLHDIVNKGFIGTPNITKIDHVDVVFLTMKANDLKNALEHAKSWLELQKPIVIIAMNGLGLRDIVNKYVPNDKIIEFSVGYPSKIELNHVINTGGNSFFSTSYDSFTRQVVFDIFGISLSENKTVSETIKEIPIKFQEDFLESQWKKGIANIAMNAISAISMLKVGEVLERKTLRIIIEQIIDESLQIADKLNIKFHEDIKQWFFNFAGKDPHHTTSTLQDFIKGKKTEIDFMNGFIVNKGKELGIETPANQSIVNLMKIVENKLI